MYRLVIILLCLLATPAIAKKSYPPYPEVWGYDVLDDVRHSHINLDPMPLKNGDFNFLYRSVHPEGKNKYQITIINFFEGKRKVVKSIEELNAYSESQREKSSRKITEYVELKDKKIIDVATNFKVYVKYPHSRIHYSYVRRIDNFEDKNEDYSVSVIGIATLCENGKECENRAYFLAPSLMALKDDTFFAFNACYPLFLRFDRNFKTKFKPQHTVKLDDKRELKSNFYVLPYSKVEHFFDHIAKRYAGEYTDDVNEQFLGYLFQEEQKGAI